MMTIESNGKVGSFEEMVNSLGKYGKYISMCVRYSDLLNVKYGNGRNYCKENYLAGVIVTADMMLESCALMPENGKIRSSVEENIEIICEYLGVSADILGDIFSRKRAKELILKMITTGVGNGAVRSIASGMVLMDNLVTRSNIDSTINILKDMYRETMGLLVQDEVFVPMPENAQIEELYYRIREIMPKDDYSHNMSKQDKKSNNGLQYFVVCLLIGVLVLVALCCTSGA